MDVASISGALAGIKTLLDLTSTISNGAVKIKVQNEILDIQAKLSEALSSAASSQMNEMALRQRVMELEKQIADAKDWVGESEGYELTQISRGVFVYMRREPAMNGGQGAGEPVHCLCAECFGRQQKSVLQVQYKNVTNDALNCPKCGTEYIARAIEAEYPFRREYRPHRRAITVTPL